MNQGKIFAGIVMTIWFCPAFFGYAETPSTQTTESVERIEVTGTLPKQYYRDKLHLAEESFFGLFNQLVKDDAFKVTCKRRKQHAFTRLTERVCEANFVADIKHANYDAAKSMQSSRNPTISLGNKAKYRKQYKAMQEKQAKQMVELINANEQLRAQFLALQKARQQYDQFDNE